MTSFRPFSFICWTLGFITMLSWLTYHVEARPTSALPVDLEGAGLLEQAVEETNQIEFFRDRARQGPSREIHITMRLEEKGNYSALFADILNNNIYPVTIAGWPFPSQYHMEGTEADKDALTRHMVSGLKLEYEVDIERRKKVLEKLLVEVESAKTKEILIRQKEDAYPRDAWLSDVKAMDLSGYWRVWPFEKDLLINQTFSGGHKDVLDTPGGIDSYYRSNQLELRIGVPSQ